MKLVKLRGKESIPIGKIVCVGRNYVEHIEELGNEVPEKPVVFLKTTSSVIYTGESIIYPKYSKEMHHETELVLLIGRQIKDVTANDAEEAITGYGIGLDMTLRDLQSQLKKKGHPWTTAKCFDTSTVLSEFVSKEDHKLSLEEELTLKVNDEIRQKDKLNKMIFNPAEIVSYLSSLMTLEKGDLIFTGTPKGVSKVEKSDKLEAEIKGIGKLVVDVI